MSEDTSYADAASDADNKLNDYTAEVGPDIIRGWNDRRKSSNIAISGLTPFVQLIGLFSELEIKKMFSFDITTAKRKVYFDDGEAPSSLGDPEPAGSVNEVDAYDDIKRQIDTRSINIYFSGTHNPQGRGAPVSGIVLAETRTQADPNNHKGGVGISDLQIDYGKSSAVGSRTYKMRLTVNDPKLFNEQVEYSKLATMNGEFVILYGWTNPTSIPGFNSLPVPVPEPDLNVRGKDKMVIPLNGQGTGGYWQAAKMNILSYDFSFNEMGQIEIAVSFIDKTSLALATQKVGPIAPILKKILGAEEYSSQSKEAGEPDTPTGGFGSTQITIGDKTMSYADAIATNQEENLKLVFDHASAAGYIPDNEATSRLLSTVDSQNVSDFANFFELDVDDMFTGMEEAAPGEGTNNIAEHIRRDKEKQLEEFPYAGTGIRVYEKVTKRAVIASNELDEATGEPPMEEVPAYNIKTTHYYFGWILESMKLGMQNTNKHKIRMGETPAIPNFTYLDNPDADQITNVFQAKQDARQHGPMAQRVQDAIIRLKEKCIPPFRARMPDDDVVSAVGGKPDNAAGSPLNFETTPCKNTIVIENVHELVQSTDSTTTELLDLVKTRAGLTDEDIDAMQQPAVDGESFRGHVFETTLRKSGRDYTVRAFIPDTNFDPSNPTDYDITKSRLYKPFLLTAMQTTERLQNLEFNIDQLQSLVDDVEDPSALPAGQAGLDFTIARIQQMRDEADQLRRSIERDGATPPTVQQIIKASADNARQQGYIGDSDEDVVRGKFFFFLRCEWRKKAEGGGIVGGITAVVAGGGLSPIGLVAGGIASAAYQEYWRTGQIVGRYKLMSPDQARMYVNWELIQRKWYNIHVKAITTEMEQLIYKRIDEIALEGRSIEDIYLEPIDLDWLTSWNFYWPSLIDTDNRIKTYDEIKGNWLRENDVPDAVEPITKQIVEYDKDIEDINIALDEVGTKLRNKLNFIERQKEQIERKTGGRFDRTLDFEDNTRRGNNFYNFDKVVDIMKELNAQQQEKQENNDLINIPDAEVDKPTIGQEEERVNIPQRGESQLLKVDEQAERLV